VRTGRDQSGRDQSARKQNRPSQAQESELHSTAPPPPPATTRHMYKTRAANDRRQKEEQEAQDIAARVAQEQAVENEPTNAAAESDARSATQATTRNHCAAFDNSTKESSLASGLAAVQRFYDDKNMFRATCACCSELFAPVRGRAVPVVKDGKWHRRLHGRLSWDHTTFTCSDKTVAQTKAQYSTSDPLLANLPLAPNGVVQEGQNLKVRV
jgi:hypothetical protein